MTEEERLKLLYRRECNRQAAQRSRMRKKDLVDNLLEVGMLVNAELLWECLGQSFFFGLTFILFIKIGSDNRQGLYMSSHHGSELWEEAKVGIRVGPVLQVIWDAVLNKTYLFICIVHVPFISDTSIILLHEPRKLHVFTHNFPKLPGSINKRSYNPRLGSPRENARSLIHNYTY